MEMPHVEYVRLTSRWTGNDSFVSCSFNVESVDGEERYSLRSKADGGLHGPATVPGAWFPSVLTHTKATRVQEVGDAVLCLQQELPRFVRATTQLDTVVQ